MHVVVLRSGTVTTGVVYGGVAGTSACSIFTNPGEILAIVSPWYWSTAGRRLDGHQVIHLLAPPGSTVRYFVFGPFVPSGTRVGAEWYDETGRMVYDTGRLPMRYTATVEGRGAAQVGVAGRVYATAVWQQFGQLDRTIEFAGVGYPAPFLMFVSFTAGFHYVGSDGIIRIQNQPYYADATGPWSNGPGQMPVNWTGTWKNNKANRYTVLDVTGY